MINDCVNVSASSTFQPTHRWASPLWSKLCTKMPWNLSWSHSKRILLAHFSPKVAFWFNLYESTIIYFNYGRFTARNSFNDWIICLLFCQKKILRPILRLMSVEIIKSFAFFSSIIVDNCCCFWMKSFFLRSNPNGYRNSQHSESLLVFFALRFAVFRHRLNYHVSITLGLMHHTPASKRRVKSAWEFDAKFNKCALKWFISRLLSTHRRGLCRVMTKPNAIKTFICSSLA